VSSTHKRKSVYISGAGVSVVLAAAVLLVLPSAVAQTPPRPQRVGRPTVRAAEQAPSAARGTVRAPAAGGTKIVYGKAIEGTASSAATKGAFEPYKFEPIDWKEIPDEGQQIVMLDAPGMQVGDFLQTISLTMGWTVVMTPEVTSKQIYAWFNNIAVRDALKVLRQAGLYYEYDKESNVLKVGLIDDYYLEKYGTVERAEFDVKHADVIDMQSTLESMLSPQGRIIANPRLSQLIVFDTKYNMRYITELLKLLDVKIEPVEITVQHVRADDLLDDVEYLLTAQGMAQVDMRTNKLIVSDIPEGINRVRAFIETVDVEVMMKTFEVKYAELEDVEDVLMDAIPEEMGRIQVDDRMREITVTSTPNKIAEAAELIEILDTKSRQVHIKAYIMRANSNLVRDLGIQWSQVAKMSDGKPLTFSVTPPLSGASEIVDIGAFGSGQYDFSALIQLLLSDDDTDVLSEPEISVIDGEQATFRVQTEVPYLSGSTMGYSDTQAQGGGYIDPYRRYFPQTVQWKSVGILLSVSPEISVTGDIELQLSIEDSNYNVTELPGVGNVPAVTVSSAQTSMIVGNGSTVILGGLRGGRREGSVNKVPILGDIPLVGRAFRTTHTKDQYQELLIFITPTVTALETAPRVAELDEFRKDFQKKEQQMRDWPLGKIKKREPPPLEPVSRGEPAVEKSAADSEGEQQ